MIDMITKIRTLTTSKFKYKSWFCAACQKIVQCGKFVVNCLTCKTPNCKNTYYCSFHAGIVTQDLSNTSFVIECCFLQTWQHVLHCFIAMTLYKKRKITLQVCFHSPVLQYGRKCIIASLGCSFNFSTVHFP